MRGYEPGVFGLKPAVPAPVLDQFLHPSEETERQLPRTGGAIGYEVSRVGRSTVYNRTHAMREELEFTHFLSAEVRLTPTNKG